MTLTTAGADQFQAAAPSWSVASAWLLAPHSSKTPPVAPQPPFAVRRSHTFNSNCPRLVTRGQKILEIQKTASDNSLLQGSKCLLSRYILTLTDTNSDNTNKLTQVDTTRIIQKLFDARSNHVT
ncbi:protein of unknown function [Trichlorobacter ammonificans]|uniref:Uncharacterized protein n=1 Tax=Trichlorobacter ammonificans TaxID=2916410 RepID=A0ABN8HEG6_9BACT|nr:protein of unknown function [Trichlorobacter ammonificans]